MKKRVIFILAILTNAGFANATYLYDGAVYDIDYVVSDYLQIGGITTVNVYDGGGTVGGISAHDSAELNIFDGIFGENIAVRDNAVATIYGGTFGKNDHMDVSIVVGEQSSTIIYGGTYSSRILLYGSPDDSPTLEFHGTDFYIGGQSVFGLIDAEELVLTGAMSKTINDNWLTYYGILTGTLEDGSILNNELKMISNLDGNHANLFVVPEPATSSVYEIIDLSEGFEEFCNAIKINDSGQVIELLYFPEHGLSKLPPLREVLLWDDGQLTDLGYISFHIITGFNNSGQVLTSRGLFENGQFNDFGLSIFDGFRDINDHGQIIGQEIKRSVIPIGQITQNQMLTNSERIAFVYDPIDGYMEFGPFFGEWTFPLAINNNGQIVCEEVQSKHFLTSYIWDMNTDEIMEFGFTVSSADINNNGQIVGTASLLPPIGYSFFWDEASGKIDLEPVNGEEVIYGKAINDSAQIVGYCGPQQGHGLPWLPYIVDSDNNAFIWEKETGVVYLNDFLEEDSQWDRLIVANDINNDGWIVGYGITNNGEAHGFLMTPVLPITAGVEIKPEIVNLSSRGKWITCWVWLGEEYDIGGVDTNSILLEGQIAAEHIRVDEEKRVIMVKFSRSEVCDGLEVGEAELIVSGELVDGTKFEGTDTVRIID